MKANSSDAAFASAQKANLNPIPVRNKAGIYQDAIRRMHYLNRASLNQKEDAGKRDVDTKRASKFGSTSKPTVNNKLRSELGLEAM